MCERREGDLPAQCMPRACGLLVGFKNSSRQSSVHFSSSLRFGTALASSLSESKSAVGRSKSSESDKNAQRSFSAQGAWRMSARTMTKRFGSPFVVHQVEKSRRLVQVRDEPAVLHFSLPAFGLSTVPTKQHDHIDRYNRKWPPLENCYTSCESLRDTVHLAPRI